MVYFPNPMLLAWVDIVKASPHGKDGLRYFHEFCPGVMEAARQRIPISRRLFDMFGLAACNGLLARLVTTTFACQQLMIWRRLG
ncbi:hypothetical protein O166_04950 [Pseudogulbenkiania ferrooxidans EGD-HP2]|uniref:Transposase n=1 Tax=Pseudogulbenkiania ferrooxidans EGD-HP2 TaxID=1388764 RepID=A0ABN0N8E2_9NEIS|nr:hypothetical protein O166_04950 [Pseudogulbenkiania ferrooxidans EGD-HP2]